MTLDDAALKVTTYTLKLSECLSCPVCGDLENEKDWHRKTWINCYENISLQHQYFDMFLHSSFFTYILFDAEQDVVLSTIYQQRSSGHFNTDHETWKSS